MGNPYRKQWLYCSGAEWRAALVDPRTGEEVALPARVDLQVRAEIEELVVVHCDGGQKGVRLSLADPVFHSKCDGH
jgi:hypothetical protein